MYSYMNQKHVVTVHIDKIIFKKYFRCDNGLINRHTYKQMAERNKLHNEFRRKDEQTQRDQYQAISILIIFKRFTFYVQTIYMFAKMRLKTIQKWPFFFREWYFPIAFRNWIKVNYYFFFFFFYPKCTINNRTRYLICWEREKEVDFISAKCIFCVISKLSNWIKPTNQLNFVVHFIQNTDKFI